MVVQELFPTSLSPQVRIEPVGTTPSRPPFWGRSFAQPSAVLGKVMLRGRRAMFLVPPPCPSNASVARFVLSGVQ